MIGRRVSPRRNFIGLLAAAIPFGTSYGADTNMLRQRYATLRDQFETLKASGVDLLSLTPLVSQIEQATRNHAYDSLPPLFDRFEAQMNALQAAQGIAIREPVQPLMPLQMIGSALDGNTEAQLVIEVRNDPLYRRLVSVRAPRVAEDGAVGRNIKGFSDVGAQRDTIWLAVRGLVNGNQVDIEATTRSMEYAFAHQAPEGYFTNTLGASPEKAVGVDAFFLQSFGRIYLLFRSNPAGPQALQRMDALRPKLSLALAWLARNTEELNRQDRLATNRLFFDSLAFYLNGLILGAPKLMKIGIDFASAGLANQRSDGTFNEHGGADSSYQAVSILNIAGLIAYGEDRALERRLLTAFASATRWEAGRILADGRISIEGNSRTAGQETFFGRPKVVNYPEVALSLLYASIIENDASLRRKGDKIVEYLGSHYRELIQAE